MECKLIKYWQGIVELVLRVVCIVLVLLVFITSIAAVSALSAPRTIISAIEDLRFDSRSPTGWLLLLAIIALPLSAALLVFRLITFQSRTVKTVVLITDVCVSVLLVMGFFGGAVPLAVHAGDWKFWRNRASSDEINMFNLNAIVSSIEATATFSFFATFAFGTLAVWMILGWLFKWGDSEVFYSTHTNSDTKPRASVKISRMGSGESEVEIVDQKESNGVESNGGEINGGENI